MRMMFHSLILLLYAAFLAANFAHAETTAAGNTYLGGREVRVVQSVSGDLVAAGGRVSIEREVGADAAISGGTVDIRAPVGQDLASRRTLVLTWWLPEEPCISSQARRCMGRDGLRGVT